MKSFVILISLLILTISTQEINYQSKFLDTVKCSLQSEALINDFNKLIEIIKEEDYIKLILKIIEIYPSVYNEVQKCLNQNINLEAIYDYGCKLGNKDHCCWKNGNGCCRPPKRFELCSQVMTICCKRKVYDRKTKKTTIEYYEGNYNEKKEKK